MVDAVFQPFPDIAPRTTKRSISSVMRFKRLGASEFSKIPKAVPSTVLACETRSRIFAPAIRW